MDRQDPSIKVRDEDPVPLSLSRASMSLRIIFVLTFPFYALTASIPELGIIMVLTCTISPLILTILDRKVDDGTYARLCSRMMITYFNAFLATFTFHNPWLRLLGTYIMSSYALSGLFPIEYKVYWADFAKPEYQRRLSGNSTIRLVAAFSASCAFWFGAISGNGSRVWLVLKFALIYITVAETSGYILLAWLRQTRTEPPKERAKELSLNTVAEPVKNKVAKVEEYVPVADIKNLDIPKVQKRPTTRRRG